MVLLHWYIKKVVHLVQQNALRMYFFHKFLSQFLGFNGFFRAFREIFPSKMPHCTYFICPIYKIRIGASSVIPSSPIHIYYGSISGSYQSVCFSPRRNTSRKMARASGPQYSSCFSSWLPRQPPAGHRVSLQRVRSSGHTAQKAAFCTFYLPFFKNCTILCFYPCALCE